MLKISEVSKEKISSGSKLKSKNTISLGRVASAPQITTGYLKRSRRYTSPSAKKVLQLMAACMPGLVAVEIKKSIHSGIWPSIIFRSSNINLQSAIASCASSLLILFAAARSSSFKLMPGPPSCKGISMTLSK